MNFLKFPYKSFLSLILRTFGTYIICKGLNLSALIILYWNRLYLQPFKRYGSFLGQFSIFGSGKNAFFCKKIFHLFFVFAYGRVMVENTVINVDTCLIDNRFSFHLHPFSALWLLRLRRYFGFNFEISSFRQPFVQKFFWKKVKKEKIKK